MNTMYPDEHRTRIENALTGIGICCQGTTFLARGANNVIYRLNCGNSTLVAKLGVNDAFRNLDKEYHFLQQVKGVGPEVFLFDNHGEHGLQLIIEEFIEGYHPYQLDSRKLNMLGEKVSLYHSINPDQFNLTHETWLDFINNRIPSVDSIKDDYNLSSTILKRIDKAKSAGFSLYQNQTVTTPVLVHGDLIPLNMLIDKCGKIRIIDWEGIRYDDAESDLATLIKAYRLTDTQIASLLEGYGKVINHEILWFRLLLHYLQVIAWRAAVQIPTVQNDAKGKAVSEVFEELSIVEQLFNSRSL